MSLLWMPTEKEKYSMRYKNSRDSLNCKLNLRCTVTDHDSQAIEGKHVTDSSGRSLCAKKKKKKFAIYLDRCVYLFKQTGKAIQLRI